MPPCRVFFRSLFMGPLIKDDPVSLRDRPCLPSLTNHRPPTPRPDSHSPLPCLFSSVVRILPVSVSRLYLVDCLSPLESKCYFCPQGLELFDWM